MRPKIMRAIAEDIRHGRNREAYTLFAVGIGLTLLGLMNLVSLQITLSAILAALTFLVFESAAHSRGGGGAHPADHVLANREGFGSFEKILPGVRDLRIYGPTAMTALTHAADLRRHVLERGGQVRILTMAPDPHALALAAVQLDDNVDLAETLRSSQATAAKLSAVQGFSCRQLPVNPGYSLVIVNADDPGGYLVYESHGFQDESIADRMHIVISKGDSPRWFGYWAGRYEAMWQAAQPVTARPGGLRLVPTAPDAGLS